MSHLRFAFVLMSAVLAGCGSNVVDNPASDWEPTKTPVGVPAGALISKVIGSTGGQLTSADGLVSITIPAGALTSNQTIGIQPITATSPAHAGLGYRFTPDGLRFASPVNISFTFGTDLGAANTIVNYGVAFQESTGAWQWITTVSHDASSRTITAHTTHFTDFGLVPGLVIIPANAMIKPRASLDLTAAACYETSRDGATYYMLECLRLTGIARDFEDPQTPTIDPTSWAVNVDVGGSATYGFVDGSVEGAAYTAPSEAPDRNVVAVSANYVINGRRAGVVVSNVTIEALCARSAAAVAPRSGSLPNALIDCNGKWIGTASVKQEGYATIEGVSITWTQDSASRGEARSYLPTGVVRFTPSDPCLQVNPSEATITEANTRASLLVFFFADSLTYVGQGGTEWLADVTDTCEGGTPRRSLVGGAWFAGGGTSRGTTTISDRKTASGITSIYNFIRG